MFIESFKSPVTAFSAPGGEPRHAHWLGYAFDPKALQHLQWRWRMQKLPEDADERLAAKHDAAAQVYVVFDNQSWPRMIKFIWSAALPVGTRFTNPLYGRGRVVVLKRGSTGQSEWQVEKVNFYAEYNPL